MRTIGCSGVMPAIGLVIRNWCWIGWTSDLDPGQLA